MGKQDPKTAELTTSGPQATRSWSQPLLLFVLLVFAAQMVWQREYWGAAILQGTLFPRSQRSTYSGQRENDGVRPISEMPIPGTPEALAISRPPQGVVPGTTKAADKSP